MTEDNQQTKAASPYLSPMQQYPSSIMIMTDPSSEIYQFELVLRGKRENSKGELQDVGKAKMNDVGINSVIGHIQTIVNRNSVFTNLKEDEVRKIVLYNTRAIRKDLLVHKVEYGIKSLADMSEITAMAVSTMIFTFKRSQDQGEKKFWKGSTTEVKQTVTQENPKKGMMQKLFGWI